MEQDFHVHMDRLIRGIQRTERSGRYKGVIDFLSGTLITTKSSWTSVPILAWGIAGCVAGMAQHTLWSRSIDDQVLAGGIAFGIVLYLFGEYSSSPPLRRTNRILSLAVLIVGSEVGAWLAIRAAATGFSLGMEYESIAKVVPLQFLIAGVIGSGPIVLAALWCWRIEHRRLRFAGIIVGTAGIASVVFFYIMGSFVAVSAWQGLVLASTCVASMVVNQRDRRK